MTELVPIALWGWIAVVLVLFAALPPRRAVLVSFLGAWLFLPQGYIPLQGLPDLTKITTTSFAVLLGVILFDAGRLVGFRPKWVDVPMLVWCLAPMASSVTNQLGDMGGLYDGLSAVLTQAANWGVPYLLGRLYLDDLVALRELAMAIVIGGLVYVPLCLIEIRLSPQLHRWLYGAHAHSFAQTIRWGGYRPTVFMQHGLMVGLWMVSATLVAVWLWTSGALRAVSRVPAGAVAATLLVTSVLCKSAGALVLLLGGFGILFLTRTLRLPVVILLLVAVPPAYIAVRAQGLWDGQQLVEVARGINPERARSLEGRFENEIALVERAMERPLWGWGGWGRWRIHDDMGRDITTSDSLWIISLGQTGLVGLTSLLVAVLLPILLVMRRIPVRGWVTPAAAAPAVLAVLLGLYMLDGLVNAMLNPIFVLAAGGLSGFYVMAPRLRARAEHARRLARSAMAVGLVDSPLSADPVPPDAPLPAWRGRVPARRARATPARPAPRGPEHAP